MDPRIELKRWREHAGPDGTSLSPKDACALVGVSRTAWVEWESGHRKPSLEKALEIEKLTEGKVSIEAWGFEPSVDPTMRAVLARRDLTKALAASPPAMSANDTPRHPTRKPRRSRAAA